MSEALQTWLVVLAVTLLSACAAVEDPDAPLVSRGSLRTKVTLSWAPAPPEDDVRGYKVYVGPTPQTATRFMFDIFPPGYDPNAPSVEFDVRAYLDIRAVDQVCFRVRAYDAQGSVSNFSDAVCKRL